MDKGRVIIVREQDELVAACCVPLDGEFVQEVGKTELFFHTKQIIKSTGELYQKLKDEYGDAIDMDIVDPRNQGYLFPRLLKDVFRYKVPLWQALKTIFALRSPAVIMSGEKEMSGQIIDQVRELLKAS